MAGSLAKLVVTLAANVAGFETDMARATKNQKKRMAEMERDMEQTAKKLGAAFAAITVAVGYAVKKTIDAADQMRDLSQQTGISTEVLSKYAYAAEQSGASLETLTGGINKMQKSLFEAASGTAKQAEAFQRLGLSVTDLMKLSPDQQFEAIAESLSKIENVTLRNATAQEIFGRGYARLIPLMKEGAGGIKEMTDRFESFNATISQDFADNADRFNDNLGDMALVAKGAAITFTEALIPGLVGFQEYLIKAATGTNDFSEAGEWVIDVIKRMAQAFAALKGILAAVGTVLVGIVAAFGGGLKAIGGALLAMNSALANSLAALSKGDFAGSAAALADMPKQIAAAWNAGSKEMADALKFIPDNLKQIKDDTDKTLADLEKAFKGTEAPVRDLGNAAVSTAGDFTVLNKKLDEARAKYADKQVWDGFAARIRKTGEAFKEASDTLDELIREQEAYEQSLQSVLDTLYPVEAAGRQLGETLALLTRANADGTLSWDQYQDAVNRAVAGFDSAVEGMGKVAQEVDLLAVAMDEGARIMERAFQSVWENILNGSEDAFDSILDGFKSLLAQMIHMATTQKVTLQIQQAFGKGGGGFADLDLGGAFGQDLVSAIGAIVGQGIADSTTGQLASLLGGLGGKWLGEQLGWWLGAWGGPLGMAIGSIAGAIIGDWIADVFARDLKFALGGENQRTRPDNQRITTPLGEILGLMGQGGAGSLADPTTPLGQMAAALQQFDTGIAEILTQFGTEDQFRDVTDALESWIGTWGESATAADVLASRFNVILSQFDTDLQDFVRGASDFEEQIQRFGVALATDKLLRENPDIFSGRTTAQVLELVAAFRTGAETMSQAFDEFLQVVNRVVNVRKALQDFAGSDPLSGGIIDVSLTEALAKVNQGLLDAITNFDGSIESLEEIGLLSTVVREGELKLLAQIDAIQKGLNANLDKLKADILGISAPDQTGEQLFNQAQRLISQITNASSVEDISGLEQQFNAIIRSIAPEDQAFMQNELVGIIELFRARANEVLNLRRQDTLDNAATVRDVVDQFIAQVGDPLAIIAASLEGQNLPEVMDDGLSEINATVATIGPQVAAALAQGLSTLTIQVNVQDAGLVTQ